MVRKTANVHLVNDRSRCHVSERRVALPIVSGGIDYYALHCASAVVAWPPASFSTVILRNNDFAAVRVEKDLGAIEAHAAYGIKPSLDSVAVDLPWLDLRDERVPIMVGAVGCRVEREAAHR